MYFCATSWIEDGIVADRLLEIWDNTTKLVIFYENLPKSKRQYSETFLDIQTAITNVLTVAKLLFFSFVTKQLKPFLTAYQIDIRMIPYMFQDLKHLALQLLVLIIKPGVVDSCKDLSEFGFKGKENGLPLKEVNIGFTIEGTLSNLLKQDIVTLAEVKLFRKQFLAFLTTILSKMFEKSRLSSSVITNAGCLILENLLKNRFLIGQ